jgi:acyl carrier protein
MGRRRFLPQCHRFPGASCMQLRDQLREGLFTTLIPLPADRWPDDDANLFQLGLDSMRVMRLLVFIEQRLKVVVPDEEVTPESIGTVNGLLRLIESHRGR